jgi:hypothetical protein
MIQEKELVEQLKNNLRGLEEAQEYLLTAECMNKINTERAKYSYIHLARDDWTFRVVNGVLFTREKKVIKIDDIESLFSLSFAFSFAFAFTFAFAYAFAFADFEKKNANTCDGKTVEIDGLKYKLSLVS